MTFTAFLAGSIATLSFLVLIVGLPLAIRKVPPNAVYGFRTPKTMSSRAIWFDANAYAGKCMIVAAIAMFSFSGAIRGLAAHLPKNGVIAIGICAEIGPMLIASYFAFRYLRKL